MVDPGMELLPPLSSPTISSISSSDLDTESTGSFFHDRSTTLGTLMGVAITFRTPTVTLGSAPVSSNSVRRRRMNSNNAVDMITERRRKRLRRRRWWWLCSGEDLKPSSLGEYLEVERRFGEEAAVMNMQVDENAGGTLFADGRVLPPPQPQASASDLDEGTGSCSGSGSVCSLCICSGGVNMKLFN